MDHDNSWTKYLYERHSKTKLKKWAKELKYFRYFRAFGGHANDCDSFDVSIIWNEQKHLLSILEKFGVIPIIHESLPPQPETGKQYNYQEFRNFKNIVPQTNYIEQPGNCTIGGVSVFIWCGENTLKLSVGADNKEFDVGDPEIEKCKIIEKYLQMNKFSFKDPPSDTRNYICPKYYPEMFDKTV